MPPKRSRQPGVVDDLGNGAKSDATKARSNISFTSAKTAPASPKVIKPNNMKRKKLVVSVDFGTACSGVAFVMSGNNEVRDIDVITDWPSVRRNEQLEKIPTRIAYASENDGLDGDVFGHEVESWHKSYSWFKLLLDNNAKPSDFDNPHLQSHAGLLSLPRGKSAQDVATDFLSFIYGHTMHKLEKVYGKGTLGVTLIQFWVTVPANWEDEAREATREAAKETGFGSRKGDEIFMISEPEAGAMAILTDALRNGSEEYKNNTACLIADLGGGTADFQIQTITSIEPLKTEEACPGTGGKCGSTFIDFELRDWLEDTFGSEVVQEISPSKLAPGSDFLDSWETVKKSFTGDVKKTYRLRLRALGPILEKKKLPSTSYDTEDGEVLISGTDVANCFQPVVDKILGLVDESIQVLKKEKRPPPLRSIALCGGLGSSEYMWQKFTEYMEQNHKGKISVISDQRAWSAVVRGGCVRGLEGGMVLSKKARRAYGMGVHQIFRDGVDKEEDSYSCPIRGKRALGYVSYFFHKGKRFTKNFKGESKVYVSIPVDPDPEDLKFCWDLYQSAADVPSIRADGDDVEKAGHIRLDMTQAFKSNKKALKASREHEADVNVVAKLSSIEGILEIEAFYGRISVGKAQIDFKKTQQRRNINAAGLL